MVQIIILTHAPCWRRVEAALMCRAPVLSTPIVEDILLHFIRELRLLLMCPSP